MVEDGVEEGSLEHRELRYLETRNVCGLFLENLRNRAVVSETLTGGRRVEILNKSAIKGSYHTE